MEVSFTPESLDAYSQSQELADQRVFCQQISKHYDDNPQSADASDVLRAVEDLGELRAKFNKMEMEPSDDDTPFEKFNYPTFRLERRIFEDPANTLHECRACALFNNSTLCLNAPCQRFTRNGVWMKVYFAIIPVSAPKTRGKKGYVPDTPDSFDFSPEKWNSVKAFIGM